MCVCVYTGTFKFFGLKAFEIGRLFQTVVATFVQNLASILINFHVGRKKTGQHRLLITVLVVHGKHWFCFHRPNDAHAFSLVRQPITSLTPDPFYRHRPANESSAFGNYAPLSRYTYPLSSTVRFPRRVRGRNFAVPSDPRVPRSVPAVPVYILWISCRNETTLRNGSKKRKFDYLSSPRKKKPAERTPDSCRYAYLTPF